MLDSLWRGESAGNAAVPQHVPAAASASAVALVARHGETAAAALLLSDEPAAFAAAWQGPCSAVVPAALAGYVHCSCSAFGVAG